MKLHLTLNPRRTPWGPRLVIAALAAISLAAFSLQITSAHKPIFPDHPNPTPDQAITIPDPNVSWAIYASLGHPNETDYYRFTAKAGLALNAQITIPALSELRNYAPHLALLGPGLPAPTSATPPLASIPNGDGVQLLDATHAGAADVFNEPFTQTTYWTRQTLLEPLATAGTYYLVVYNRPTDAVQTGKYVLAVGNVEQFGPGDLLSFPNTYVRVRAFMQAGVPLWAWVVLGIIAAVVALRVRVHYTKKAQTKPVTPTTETPTTETPTTEEPTTETPREHMPQPTPSAGG